MPKSPLNAEFEKIAADTLSLWHVPGVSVAVVDGRETWAEGYGMASFPSTRATASTLYSVGSTTKAFTAAALSLLVDKGKLTWDTPISSLIKEDFVVPGEHETNHITVEDALSHRTGMPRHDFSYGGRGAHSAKEVTRLLRYLPRTAEIRTKWMYCKTMYMALAHLIESLTDMYLGDYFQKNILTPLGMASTYFTLDAGRQAPEPLAEGYYWNDSESKFELVPDIDLYESSGAGMLVSNVLDFSKWIFAMINEGGPISKAGHDVLRTPRIHKALPTTAHPFIGPVSYTLGWETGIYQGYQFFTHTGGTLGYSANIVWLPAIKFGVVAMGNTAVTSKFAEDILIWHLIDEKLEIPAEKRFKWNERNKLLIEEQKVAYNNSLETFYPNRASPPIPTPVPLQGFTGTYHHPGYRQMTVCLENSGLYILRTDVQWKIRFDLEHVSETYFLAKLNSIDNPGGYVFKECMPVEFKFGADGTSKTLGIRLEKEMGSEKIWFERV